ncbi:probable serine/threonine-protein kinase PBL7 [Papaver somniferum]|uniref:probable serine/threonine-protein kinase PBL7 n=1 Tax=Papaver somniferum TaxID=3469 RepID=UPI000E70288F|nr:probable serine/threonine-protein kinase PBL7 [Papaver somniferum]
MIGYCDKGEYHIIVYEIIMPLRSLNLHFHDLKPGKKPLDWKTRMKIAEGVAKALEYLHDQKDPPIIYGGWKETGILLDENYNPKLSNFECAKYGPTGDYSTLFSKLRYGYTTGSDICTTGKLTLKSDIYSFGMVLLELISGRKACDITKTHKEHFIHAWARPLLSDSEKFPEIADPLMKGQYPCPGTCPSS